MAQWLTTGGTPSELILGGTIVALTAFFGGVTGFGAALASTPVLLSVGFPLDFVVTANLILLLFTRASVSLRMRGHANPMVALMLILGSVPGAYIGVRVLGVVEGSTIKIFAGVVVMFAAVALLRAPTAGAAPKTPVVLLAAGLAGGFLGSATSLSGVPPAIAMARQGIAPAGFLANLAAYFVFSSAFTLVLLAWEGMLAFPALRAAALWLPGAVFGNFLGVVLGTRLPEQIFRRVVCAVIFAGGAATVVTSW